jgi:hypothetical protein
MRLERSKKIIACFFLAIFSLELLLPVTAHALTNGPEQPEMKKFEPAGASNMVDLFTGNFKYNIPLFETDGYPMNLAYNPENNMEDESSWVGLGWTLNPGSVNRDMRGLPDDFNGDPVIKDYKRKNFKKIGGQITLKPSIFAWEFGSASLKVGIYKDNYYGMGAELGASVGFQLARNKKTTLTAGLDYNLDSRAGASISPNLELTRAHDYFTEETVRTLNGSFEYNSRAGLKQMALGGSFSLTNKAAPVQNIELSAVKYFGQSYTPTFDANMENTGVTFNFDFGPTFFGAFIGIGGSGYVYNEKLVRVRNNVPAYGYLNYLNGRKKTNSLIDFNREKDGVYIPGVPALPVPVATQDFFTASSQSGSQQFRPYFGGNYVVFDKHHYNMSVNAKLGITLGVGAANKNGARFDLTGGQASTHKWVRNNTYLSVAEPQFSVVNKPDEEAMYFKSTGEYTRSDVNFLGRIKDDKTVQVVINDKNHVFPAVKTYPEFKWRETPQPQPVSALKKTDREVRTNMLTYLPAKLAQNYALEKKINGESRVTSLRKADHISEMTMTTDDGQRMVYGIPVYNIQQRDVNFSVAPPSAAQLDQVRRTGQVNYIPGFDNNIFNFRGRDQLFSRTIMPGYPTSFLLTAILSPDYVDLTNNGITDDDHGSALKFKYSKLGTSYKWRAPYGLNTANYNEGYLSDPKDDKGSYVYGEKEVWYLDTIESKTTIAIFYTSDREDGLGVLGENGGQNTAVRLKKLDYIRIYSKADLVRDEEAAIPIKTIHFEYDYSLFKDIPNNSGAPVNNNGEPVDPLSADNINKDKGKLTLKRVYFTFGTNLRGKMNPYDFEYDNRTIQAEFPQLPIPFGDANHPESKNTYAMRQLDRWGTYKPSWYNHLTGSALTDGKLNNSEFSYAIQDNENTTYDERGLANLLASKWQLNKITTPSGSIINVVYEADDYGYVQNRRAMQMCFVSGVGNTIGAETGMNKAPGFVVDLPVTASNGNFKQLYLTEANGQPLKNIFYKILTDIDNAGHKEYIQGYAEINLGACQLMANGTKMFVALKPVNGYNAVSKAAWQMIKTDLPQYAYDNYDNSDANSFGDDVVRAVRSLVQAYLNQRELFVPFEKSADGKDFSDKIDLSRSMIRLCNPLSNKIGGGTRVRQVTVSDDWQEMTSQTGKTSKFGQLYDYSTKNAAGDNISSGVAAYEPSIGNDENPFHEPISYTEKVHWAPDKYHFVEKPFCETFFPAPTVGYSKVTVTDLGDRDVQNGTQEKHTGYIEHEFYTAREFPTLVDNMTLEPFEKENNLLLKLFTSTYKKQVAASQGFKVEVNDMHGNPKSTKVYNKSGDLVSAIENFYSVMNENDEEKQLNNNVSVMDPGGKVEDNVLIGTDVDFVTDVRESFNESIGAGIGGYQGGMPWPFPPFYLPYAAVNANASINIVAFNSISTVKVIHRYGILKKIRNEKNGSSVEVENLVWDGETGEVVLSRSQNEFNDHIYSFSYPAYLAAEHEGMGNAYKNIGAIFTNLVTQSDGIIPSTYQTYVFPGDVLVNTTTDKRGWVIKSINNSLRLIDDKGEFIATSGSYMVLRSGRRNMSSASAGTIVCLGNPLVEVDGIKKIQISSAKRILDAKAIVYKDEWGVPVSEQFRQEPEIDDQYCPNECLTDWLFGSLVKVYETSSLGTRRGMFSQQSDNMNVNHLMDKYRDIPACDNFGGQPAASSLFYQNTLHTVTAEDKIRYELQAGDIAQLGIFQVVIDWVSPAFNDLANFSMTEAQMLNHLNETITANSVPRYCLTPVDYVNISNPASGWCKKQLVFRRFDLPCNNNVTIEPCSPLSCSYTDLLRFHLTAPPEYMTIVNKCVDPLTIPINPYVTGVLGNWRPDRDFAYTVPRVQKAGLNSQTGGTDIRTSGYYASFNPFWNFKPTGGIQTSVQAEPILPAERWVWDAQSVYYDQKGNEVENMDALNRYGSALFGYRESAVTAVIANGRRNEIAFDGFEDYNFSLQSNLLENCPAKRHFDWGFANVGGTWTSPGGTITSATAHTGNYSYALTGTVSITRNAGNAAPPTEILGYDANGRYRLQANELANGFAPINGKKYLLSMWVREDEPIPTNTVKKLGVAINGQTQSVNTIMVAVVEGWKRLEIPFTAGSSFSLSLTPTGNVWIDDVRILPFDGQLSSFVYDDKSMRMLAQLDQNNFATIYEYDEEGSPVRVKKETERGIMTLKENRQGMRKRE